MGPFRCTTSIWIGLFVVTVLQSAAISAEQSPHQATGFKIGEVTDRSAIVWTRLTQRPSRNPTDGPQVRIEYEKESESKIQRERQLKGVYFPNGCTVSGLKEAVPGTAGEIRVLYRTAGESWRETPWQSVNPLGDFTRQVSLGDLKPASIYEVRVESRSVEGKAGSSLEGRFRTAPTDDDARPIRFAVATCFGNDDQDTPDGFKIYAAISNLDPDFFVHTGDIVYYDDLAKTVELARYHWQRTYSWPGTVLFHRNFASYFIKDDHDTWKNDCWPTMAGFDMGEFTFQQGQQIFREQVPMGHSTYRTIRWGKDLQMWLVEGRDFRSSHEMADGPEKTIWGADQMKWFKQSVNASQATFRILISPTPIVGPDRAAKDDNYSNSGFAYEGKKIREFLAEKNMIVLCGDRHWQYLSVDPSTQVKEYSVGPASDSHAGGWKQENYCPDYHRFLRVAGGFLSVTIDRKTKFPEMALRFHDVDGNIKHEDVVRQP